MGSRKHRHLYFRPEPNERGMITNRECVLLQRTTAKEQPRRLIAAKLPGAFIAEHGGAVVENHVNIIMPRDACPSVPVNTLAAILNSHAINELFRCINGSVAVSAYELEDLPLPGIPELSGLNELMRLEASHEDQEDEINRLYGDGAP